MTTTNTAPSLGSRFFCVVDRESVHLAAVISSYISKEGIYTPFVTFPGVTETYRDGSTFDDDDYVGNVIGSEAATFVNNALARIGGCTYFLVAGLSKAQTSFLHSAGRATVIEIQDVDEVARKLATTCLPARKTMECKSEQVLLALRVALRTDRTLHIDDSAGDLTDDYQAPGIIVVEEHLKNASTVVGVNYAAAVNASVALVKPLDQDQPRGILELIQRWREDSDNSAHEALLGLIAERVSQVDFGKYDYATFFTDGLPYSIGLTNAIPCSYVNLSLRADLFILNNIISEQVPGISAAVVFSLDEFYSDGEAKWLVDLLTGRQYYVRPLVGSAATVSALDYNAQHFPYSIFHIASHGGEVEGYAVSQDFIDRNGIKHVVEYDEVVAFGPGPRSDLVEVVRKLIFRKFDGLVWRSKALRAKNLPHSVYDDMRKAILDKERMGDAVRQLKRRIPASCGVQCTRGFHQGTFQVLASHGSPFVFNNTCWSWSDVAQFFLTGGARAYIGTLWSIENDSAIRAALAFYPTAMTSTLLDGLCAALKTIATTNDKDVYIFWGLHFARLPESKGVDDTASAAFSDIVQSLFRWIEQAGRTKSGEVRKNALDVVRKLLADINGNFDVANMADLNRKIARALAASSSSNPQPDRRRVRFRERSPDTGGSVD